MNLDELRAVQEREREKDSLQHLRDSFYEEVGSYLADLRAERQRRADDAEDPFADPEVRRLTEEIETAEEVAESVYERRMGKVVKTASLAAAGYAAETEGLTAEEADLFEDLVARIEANQETVLDVLGRGRDVDLNDREGREPSGMASGGGDASEPISPGTGPEAGGSEPGAAPSADEPVADADAPAGGEDGGSRAAGGTPAPPPDDAAPDEGPAASNDGDAGSGEVEPSSNADDERPPAEAAAATADEEAAAGFDAAAVMGDDDRVTLRITDDVGEIVGVDGTAYDLAVDDVVTLPEENALPLVEKDAATRLD